MARAWAVGAAAALIALLLYESALAWVSIMGPALLPPLFLLLSYVGIGAAAGHASVSLTGGPHRAWPAAVVVAVAGAVLIGWGRNAELLHPALDALPAALGGGACTAVGGWLGLVLPNVHRSAAPASVVAQLKTIEVRAKPRAVPVSDGGRHHQRRAPVPAESSDGPDILEFGL